MQKLATAQTFTDAPPLSRKRFSLALAVIILFLAALWFGLCRELSGEWSVNEQYNFGWFVPFFALYLFWLRWQDRPPAQIANRKSQIADAAALAIAIAALLLLFPLRLFEIANPEWRLLAWIHTLAVVTLTLFLIWSAGGNAWLLHFAFPVAFIFVAVPWPTALETPVIQGLMRLVARVAAETAMLLGTPAQVEGNLIRVSNGLVGVNEACSGIRSLQTSLMIGLLFGELKRLSVSRRLALVLCAVAIALLANFLRAVFLVRVAATENLSEVSRWHDIAGYSIIALVFLATFGLAYLFGKSQRNSDFQPESAGRASSLPVLQTECPLDLSGRMPELRYIAAALCWLLFVVVASATWYRLHEHNLVSGVHWSVRWPEQAPNFRKLKIDAEVRAVLRFDQGEAAAWSLAPTADTARGAVATGAPLNEPGADAISCLLYVLRWDPGKNSALLANLHRPDVCLPASGWKQVADYGVRSYPVSGNANGAQRGGYSGSVDLPFRHFEFQRAFGDSAPQTAHAFYCLSEDRASAPSSPQANANGSNASPSTRRPSAPGMFGNRSEWTRTERIDAVLQGRRHLGQQAIEVILISTEPFSVDEAETQLSNLLPNVVASRSAENRQK